MECNYFGQCGACRVYEDGYEGQLQQKLAVNKERFSPYYTKEIEVFRSPDEHYRARAEFKIWHEGESIHYAMNHIEGKGVVFVDECPQVNEHIAALMPKLLKKIQEDFLGFKLFGADFLSSSSGEIAVSLLYHRKLEDDWEVKAKKIAKELGIYIIGRSRKQKVVIGQDFITESLTIDDKIYKFNYIENSFTQPNPRVNEQMIAWAMDVFGEAKGDLLELYCGAGNFTIPFATMFDKVLATEISKSSINAAKSNMTLNDVHNIEFIRMSVEEFTQALKGVREFRRMNHINMDDYNIKSIFVDPPRSGMDEFSCDFTAQYDTIVYISCNPETLYRDLEILCKSHEVAEMALFDQFPYTHHVEMGVKLTRKGS
ncbi:tRNA (uridine(54)-C5)-methyltransferase TrmA [Sulfurimonas paralvinellae]|uniref:tRNA (Uridine(54)-C5)-methyltransferase TrmA n=1 Tax=Sulfurimonas paralvinellae TaxID=317658 RepID=A0A7M1B7A0_9BACT|nr:tRNA (uridine(54)-C5)-methyltransferase TrmA [Sulfurimonas paralvinellae]QOP45583.1 tRNA (uridine(54)-C5)-methyltransferase TrmA [Sulfurimonas paralvinellae]